MTRPAESVLTAAARILAEVLVVEPADRLDALAVATRAALDTGSLDAYRLADQIPVLPTVEDDQ